MSPTVSTAIEHKRRVLFVGGSLGGGGAERQLLDLYRSLSRNRFDVRMWLVFREGELLAEVAGDEAVEFGVQPGLMTRIWGRLYCPVLARVAQLRAAIQRHQPDVIVAWSLKASYLVSWAVGSQPIPWIASSVLEPDAEVVDAFGTDLFRNARAAWTYQRATQVLANSTASRQRFMERYRLADRKLPSALHARDLLRVDRLAMAEAPTWPGTGRRILGLGRLAFQKGLDVLLQSLSTAALEQQTWQLVLLGTGPQQSALQQLAHELGLADRVWFLGFQDNPYAWLQSADLFVLSSRFEGLPNVLIEAIVCQVPVIATDCPTGPREILEGGRWGRLVPVGDVPALAGEIARRLAEPISPELLQKAKQAMFDRYDLTATVPRFEHLLIELADHSASGN